MQSNSIAPEIYIYLPDFYVPAKINPPIFKLLNFYYNYAS